MNKEVRFEGEEESEQTLILLRPHIFTNVGWILVVAVFLALPLFAGPIWGLMNVDFEVDSTTALIALLTWDLVLLMFAFQKFLFWYFNIYIVTNLRIVDIDFHDLFYRKTSQTSLRNIEDVHVSKGGLAQNFFDYGDLNIQTAGTQVHFEFLSVPDPEGVQRKLLELITFHKKPEK